MTLHRWTLAFCFSLVSVLRTGESQSVSTLSTAETLRYVCKTFGSGVMQPFNGSGFHVRSNCPFTLTRFTHNRVEYDITTRRGNSGLLTQLEITVNKIRTIVQGGSIEVEKKSISLPYDHTYQHIFQYGTYIKLRSSLVPLSVTWHNVSGGIDFVRVELELEKELNIDMTGLCGKLNVPGNKQQLIAESVLTEDTCQTRDPVSAVNPPCRQFFSYTLDCLQVRIPHYIELCEENIHSFESSKDISCAFFKEVVQECGNNSYIWNVWRIVTRCAPPSCPGDLVFVEQGPAFVPSCSNPNPRFSNQDLTSSCVCPEGMVVNDQAEGIHCVKESNCPCVFAGRSYSTGNIRSTKCQSCVCEGGKWHCSENSCPARCLMEGQFVTTFDGKQYVVPGKCTYVVSQGYNWTIIVQFSEQRVSLQTAVLQLFQDTYTFSYNRVKVGEKEITELHQSDHALVFWQSSMYIQVQTSFGMNIQVQMSPEIQLYITLPKNHTGVISGLCGNSNNDTTDDFTTSSGIIENSPQAFALSWSAGTCVVNIPSICSSTDSEIFADEGCSVLNEATGIFATCHSHIPTDQFHTACIQRICNCGNNLQQCLCVALGSYAKACGSLGVAVGDWRKATNCTLNCQKNQEFSYDVRACNHTCRLLSGPDPRCWLDDAPLEGCGCPEGTHLNQGHVCTPKAECVCHHYGGTTPPGPVVIDGRQCLCENGELHCSKDCGCRNGKVCVHCSEYPVNTAQKTCDSLSKPLGSSLTCESGCHCPHDQYEDHHGNCVSLDNCTCVYSGKMFSSGQHVKTNCKTCVCGQGQWHCKDEPCTGKCQVYGNGHYQTFDSKWYRFNGHCQYTLVEDYCGNENGSFSVRVESVPCCDEALTCSRSIVLDLQGTVTLTLSDMRVTRRLQKGWTLQEESFYTTHTVGLYIVISVPSRGITLIWDKHTRITVELHPNWRNRVCGLCGNFDSSEMNDLQISGSAVVSSPMAFGNNWKATSPPCSDVTTEIFPCERNSYCSAWAQRRCMIITADTFKDCHLKVDPEPYYHACVQESCSCEFEGKFLGFCTAVAAYAEACSEQDVCVKWRTPDLCPVYCDYYNEQGQCSWHYEACGEVLTCGKGHYFIDKLEGCYPRCPKDAQFYDENTGECTKLRNCTCFFNDTIIQPGAVVMLDSIKCPCENGTISCPTLPTTISPTTSTSSIPTTTASTTRETTVPSTTPTTTTASTTKKTRTPTSSTTPSPTTTSSTTTETLTTTSSTTPRKTTTASTTTEPLTTTSSATPSPTTTSSTTTETLTTMPTTTPTPTTTSLTTTEPLTTTSSTTPSPTTTASTTTEPLTPTSLATPTPTTTSSTTTETLTTMPITTPTPTTPASTTTEPLTTMPTTTPTSTITASNTTETLTTTSSTTPTPTTYSSTTTETLTKMPITTPTPTTTYLTTTETLTTMPITTPTPTTPASNTTEPLTTTSSTTPSPTTTASTTTEPLTTTSLATPTPTTTSSTTTETLTTMPITTPTPTTPASTTTEPLTTTSSTTPSPTTTASTTTEPLTTTSSATPTPTTTSSTTTETLTTMPITTPTPTTTSLTTTEPLTTTSSTTRSPTTTASTTTEPLTPTSLATPTPTTTSSTTTETLTTMPTTTPTPTITALNTTETLTTMPTTISTPNITASNTTETLTTTSTTTPTPTTTSSSTTETLTTMPSTTPTPTTPASTTTEPLTTTSSTTPSPTTTASTTTEPLTTTSSATPTPTTTSSTTTETSTTMPRTTPTPTTTSLTTTETLTTMPSTTPTPTITASTTSETLTTTPSTTPAPTITSSITTETLTTTSSTTPVTSSEVVNTTAVTTAGTTTYTLSTQTTTKHAEPHPSTTIIIIATNATSTSTSVVVPTSSACIDCTDLKRNKTWACGETWKEDCFHRICNNGKIELTPVVCPEPTSPICPRDQVTKVSDGCCETWKCDCRCELYGDPHYISFAGVPFDFLDECSYILVEEQSPQHRLSIAVDNIYCVPGLHGSCAKGIILKYQDNVATLSKVPDLNAVKATLNNVTIQPPYEEQGLRFETTGYAVSIYLPKVRSYVSLSPSYTLVVNLAMEHFLNNTQGQCGVCGGGSCIRRGGQIEDNNCCDKTAYDWVFADPLNSACVSRPRDVPCHPGPPTVAPPCFPPGSQCELLDHPVFQNCRTYVNLQLKKKNCEFDSCGNTSSPCSSLEQAAEECKKAGICIDWRKLTNGTCDVPCPKGLVHRECHDKLDDFCYGGVRYPGASLEKNTVGCFCPSGYFRAGNHSINCVSDCQYCKGPLGEPRLPGEVWQSNCHQCSCNNQTRTEECFLKSPKLALCEDCGPEKNCSYKEKTYKVGVTWKDAAHPCMSFSCSIEGIQTERRICPKENCPESDRVWDNQNCGFTCNQSCAPKMSSFNITIENCTTVIEMPVCQGLCVSQPRVVLHGDLQVEHNSRCCLEQRTERRSLTLQCLGLTTRRFRYKHITSCECRACSILY
ncbi:mucin-2-like isoform X2 [Platichthys flesus]|uniref:mucin-2-like isoform X2 n=1 Tax=Platichthys flesus TaxID=8260 RepID=UPI002DBE0996|nr:mucin-2-like isoform X2 [Platichthys flesus]